MTFFHFSFFNQSNHIYITDIKKAYRSLARKNHPDVIRAKGITDDSIIRKAKEKFQLINDAYEQILKIKGIK